MYRYELHMHTCMGSACARNTIEEMITAYKKAGYAGMAVTEHFIRGNTAVDRSLPWDELVTAYAAAYLKGREYAEKEDFDLLFGIEEGYGGGKEFLAYGFEPQFVIDRPFLRNASVDVWAKEIHSVGGFIAYAHPFRDRDYIKDPNTAPDISIVDGVEAYNFCNKPNENEKAVNCFKGKTILTAGSDIHSTDFNDSFGIELKERVSTSSELAKVLLTGDFNIYLGKSGRPY